MASKISPQEGRRLPVHPMAKGFSFLFVTIRKIYTYIGHKTGRVLWDETEPRLSAPV